MFDFVSNGFYSLWFHFNKNFFSNLTCKLKRIEKHSLYPTPSIKHKMAEEKKMAAEYDNPRWAPVIAKIRGAFHQKMETGFIPKDPEEIMNILKGIPVTQSQVRELALGNKLEWIRGIGETQTPEDYKKWMNKALAHYLKEEAAESDENPLNKAMARFLEEAAPHMDSQNRKAAEVMRDKGLDAGAAYMMKKAGGDYSTMRSMFG